MDILDLFNGVRYGKYDKTVHFFVSLLLTLALLLVLPLVWAVGTSIVIGVSKEVYDRFYRRSQFSVDDVVVNLAGTLVAVMVFSMIRR